MGCQALRASVQWMVVMEGEEASEDDQNFISVVVDLHFCVNTLVNKHGDLKN
jgi:hypothetical protein